MGPEIGALATTVLMMTIEALELFGDTVQYHTVVLIIPYSTWYTVFVHEDTRTVPGTASPPYSISYRRHCAKECETSHKRN